MTRRAKRLSDAAAGYLAEAPTSGGTVPASRATAPTPGGTVSASRATAPVGGATAVLDYAFEQLTPAEPRSRDALADLVAQAEAQATRVHARAREEGYAEGHAAGHSEGLAEAGSAAQALSEALVGVSALRVQTALAVERDAIELAVVLAEKILSGALEAKPELVAEVAQGALRRIGDRRRVTLLVNPADVEAVAGALGLQFQAPGGVGVGSDGVPSGGDSRARAREGELCEVQADPRVPRGGAIAQTEEGEIDAGVHTQLDRARELMLAQLMDGENSISSNSR